MAAPELQRRLIVNADDFGRSESINRAVLRAYRDGILTSASLMVNEPACAAAVAIARENPGLGVGLHLTLVMGRSALPPATIPGLVGASGRFPDDPAVTGMKLFFRRSLRDQLRAEIAAQFEKFHATGLPLDHVNGHLNIHLHPAVFSLLMENAGEWGIRCLRLTRDPFLLNARIASGRWIYRVSHAAIFTALAAWARPQLRRRGIRHTGAVFGLLQNACVHEDYCLRLLPLLPAGDSELYSHPSTDEFKSELDALLSPKVRALADGLDIRRIRCQEL